MSTHTLSPCTTACALFFAALFISTVGTAQPVLHHIGDMQIGMELRYLRSQPQQLVPLPPGAGVVWDLTGLATSEDTLRQWIIHPDSSQFGGMFPNATLVERDSDGLEVFVEKGEQDHVWGVRTATGMLINYTDPYTFLQRPFTYGDIIQDNSTRHYIVPPYEYSGAGSTITHADGWGTLMLPGATYENVLRVRYEQDHDDHSDLAGTMNIRMIGYAWYDDMHRGALLMVDSVYISSLFFTDTIADVSYLLYETPMSIRTQEALNLTLYHADDALHIAGDLHAGDRLQLKVHDASGRLLHRLSDHVIASAGRTSIPMPLADLSGVLFITAEVLGSGHHTRTTTRIIR